MAFTFRSYSYREACPGSPEETIGQDRAAATVVHYWPWDERANMAIEFLGYSELATADTGGGDAVKYIRRVLPWNLMKWRSPRDQGRFLLYANEVRLSPENGIPQAPNVNDEAQFDEARAVISLTSRNYSLISDARQCELQGELGLQNLWPDESTLTRFVSVEFAQRARYQTIPGFSLLSYNSTPVRPVAQNSGIILQEGDVSITWYNIPAAAYPKSAIARCMGKTNRFPFGALAGPLKNLIGVFPVGTLVCLQPQVRQHTMPTGELACDVTYKFNYVPNIDAQTGEPLGVNSILDLKNDNGRYTRVSRNGATYLDPNTGVPVGGTSQDLLFPGEDLRDLFRPEP